MVVDLIFPLFKVRASENPSSKILLQLDPEISIVLWHVGQTKDFAGSFSGSGLSQFSQLTEILIEIYLRFMKVLSWVFICHFDP